MEVKLRKKTLEERIDQLAMDVAILKVQFQKLYDSLHRKVMEDEE